MKVPFYKYYLQLFAFILLLNSSGKLLGQQSPAFIFDGTNPGYCGEFSGYYVDHTGIDARSALNAEFTPFSGKVQSIQKNKNSVWVKFDICNRSNELIGVKLDLANFDYVDYYLIDNGTFIDSLFCGERRLKTDETPYNTTNIFTLEKLKQDHTNTILVRLVNTEQIVIPLKIDSQTELEIGNGNRRFMFGIYTGIMLVMFIYNIFLAFSVRERIYIFYLLHLFFAWLTQASFQGIASYYFWTSNTFLIHAGFTISTCMVSIMGILFMRGFLQTGARLDWQDKVLRVFLLVYTLALLLTLAGFAKAAFSFVLPMQALVAVFILYSTIILILKGSRQARFYLIGWAALFVGITIYVLKDFGFIPYNNFTNFSLQAGTALEVVLLSIALADRINILEQEKKEMVKRQKEDLQREVNLRTAELRNTNHSLEKAYNDLKEAQTQLINAEKMASLGQLTAGIAHEINNPINFINANVKPLTRDFNDLIEVVDEYSAISGEDLEDKLNHVRKKEKEIDLDYTRKEIVQLLAGMAEGAQRTTEIVRGLRIFSRLDEADFNKSNIIEGLESTIILLNSAMGGDIILERDYDDIPLVDCYPGKLNQVFMNIISNAIYAVRKRQNKQITGKISIAIRNTENNVIFHFTDNGIGMDTKTARNMFEPFFTTKPVGDGTGMGMTISYGIIVLEHHGKIFAESVLGKGTTITIEIPKNLAALKAANPPIN